MSLPALLADLHDENHVIRGHIPEGWLQGRTSYGGLSATLALAACKRAFEPLPPLRSAQIAFVGPLAGAIGCTPTMLRRGKNSAFVECRVSGDDGTGLQTLFLFMSPRESAVHFAPPSAPKLALDETKLIDPARVPQGFLTNFEFSDWQFADGVVRRWVRLRERASLDPELELVAVADALPPAAMTLIKGWGPISTTTWQLNLLHDHPTSRDGWWLLEATTLQAGDGSSSQAMTIWNRDGEAAATATQSVALFL